MNLPQGWETVNYLQSFTQESTSNRKVKTKDCKEEGMFPVIDQGQEYICGYVDDQDKVIKVETPLIIFGDHTRLIKWIDFNFVPGADGTKVLKPEKIYYPRFFYHQMRNIELPDKGYSRHFKFLKEVNFLLPPLNEQKRIAKKLDELLATVEGIKIRLDNTPMIIKRFRHSILATATSGKLTETWRKNNGVSGEWKLSSFAKLGELSRGKSKHRPRNDSQLFGGDYPFIQTGAVAQSGGLITEHSKTLSEFGLKQSRLFPENTLCITIAANIADTAFLTYPVCFPDSVVGFIADEEVCQREFIKYFIDVNKDNLETFAPATAQKNINLAILNALEIPIPTLTEQKEIVAQVESLFALADTLEEKIEVATKRVDNLTQSILTKAFRGELVPQDPNDEPAEELLKRIKAKQKNTKTVIKSKKVKPIFRCNNSDDLKKYIKEKFNNDYFKIEDIKNKNICTFEKLFDYLLELIEKELIISKLEKNQKLYKLKGK